MTKDRAADRHDTAGYVYRPKPSDLLKRVDEVHGKLWRSKVISSLLRRYLVGEPMPTAAEVEADWDKTGQGHGA